jgi:AraC-like DNA-binding protein
LYVEDFWAERLSSVTLGETLMPIFFSTGNHSKSERAEHCRDLVSKGLVPMEFHLVGDEIHGWGRMKSVGLIKIFEVRSSFCVLSRTPSTIRRHDPEYGKVELVLEGKMVVGQDGRQAILGAGDFTIHDLTRPFEIIGIGDVRLVSVMFPLFMVSMPRTRLRDLTATRMDGSSGSGALLASFLAVLSSKLDHILPQEEGGISSAVGDLLAATLAQLVGDDATIGTEGPRSVLVTRIRNFVEAEVADPGLNPASIAAAHHISLRQLHRLFEREDMTVTELIRTHRLEGCRYDLADPALRGQSISAIATRWGISDSAKFSRMFRAAYDVSPREYRTVRLAGTEAKYPDKSSEEGKR